MRLILLLLMTHKIQVQMQLLLLLQQEQLQEHLLEVKRSRAKQVMLRADLLVHQVL